MNLSGADWLVPWGLLCGLLGLDGTHVGGMLPFEVD